MKFSFEESMENGGLPVMNIEHNDHIYKLYVGNDCYVHLVKDSSTEFTSSTNLESCLNCSMLSKKTRAFYQNVIIYGAFYEVLQEVGICKDFSNITMKLLNIFMYSSLDYLNIKYDCQYSYTQFRDRIFSQMRRNNDPILCDLEINQVFISEEEQCFYLKLTPNDKREFYYGKCIDKTNEKYFIYNLICVLLHFCYATEDYYVSYEYFLDTMNQPDGYPYQDELKSQIIEAFGNTEEIQNAFQLSPSKLWDYLFTFFDSDTTQLKREEGESRAILLKSIKLKTTALLELNNLIK